MKYIENNKIYSILEGAKVDKFQIKDILEKSKSLGRLSLQEVGQLLKITDEDLVNKLFETAAYVKEKIYGKRVVLFAPMYISNQCCNNCLYCGFRADNKAIVRKALTEEEIKEQIAWLLKRGHKRILMVAGESAPQNKKKIDFYIDSIRAIYEAKYENNSIRRVNVNVAPLSKEEFKILKTAGIGTYQLFQETYHDETYKRVHLNGPKSDPDIRMQAIDDAFECGIDDVGIGVLYGLYDWKFETLALMAHIEHLENKFNVGPHTISVPRIESADGAPYTLNPPYKLQDIEFKKLAAILRLAVPYTGLILSTRETAKLRDELFNYGISQISAESKTSPGGYKNENGGKNAQFGVHDERSLDEIISSLIDHGCVPSFCTACYRSGRTGEAFMGLAKPGNIKGKCSMNALLTLTEYLDDFASADVKEKGRKLIESGFKDLSGDDKNMLNEIFCKMKNGKRDEYV
ncbi:MAG: [FeFe] hydrogenase H-cluster radical SAM maturase HydG [Elusimicrobiota bacterium]